MNANGQLGTATTSARFKGDQANGQSDESVFAFNPVSFNTRAPERDTAIWLNCRRIGEGEPRFGRPEPQRRDLQCSLRSGERDVVERVP